MPYYDYECSECGKVKEVFHRMADDCEDVCDCGGELEKLIGKPTIKFKGSGFHINDYPTKK